MTPDRWRQISRVYHAARDVEPSQRPAFLDQVCAGDETLRRDLESLLREDSADALFLEQPALDVATRVIGDEPHVSLEGAQLGPYQVQDLLGAGGMGRVYRARDIRLKRDVALKVLSQAAGTDRHRRFAREALAAGSLNHPNIVAVYDVGVEKDGPYLVSELIDGVSLRQEMERGRVTTRRLLDIGCQIAEGLAAAHDAGIVHRDLKPENLMVTPEGRIKIVDFGLAKPLTGEETPLAGSASLTLTAEGALVGTAPYMSPEQAQGDPVDFRSDQFSLGVILYELATDQPPFRRETRVQTLAAIVGDEPPDVAQANPGLPVPVRWVVQRLLAKNPANRYAHTADIAAELRAIRDHLSELGAGTPRPAAEPRTRGARVRAALGWLAILAFGVGVGVFATPQRVASPPYRYTPLATDAGYQGAPAWSPDGTMIAYVAEVNGILQVFTKRVGSTTRNQVTQSAFDCHDPFWSPDGRSIYYHRLARDKDALWRVSPAGEPSDLVFEGASRAAISPDGRTLALARESPGSSFNRLWLSSPPGNTPTQYTRLPLADFSEAVFRFSPDSTKLLAWIWTVGGQQREGGGLWLIDLQAGEQKRIRLSEQQALPQFSWMPDNLHVVYVNPAASTPGSHLQLLDTRSGALRQLTSTYVNEGFPAVAPDGRRVAFTSESTDFDLILAPLDGSAPETLLSSTRNEFDPAWSPVAPQYAYVTDGSGALEIRLRNDAGNWERTLVTDADFTDGRTITFGSLAFSPDGQRLAYQRLSPTGYRIWISPLGGGRAVQLTDDPRYQDAPTWSPDGTWVAFVLGHQVPGSVPGTAGPVSDSRGLFKSRVGGNASLVRLATDVQLIPIQGAGRQEFSRPQWSPDGRLILMQTEAGLTLVAADGSQTQTVSEAFWLSYGWTGDGTTIYGLQPTDDQQHFKLVALDLRTGRERVVNANLGLIPRANQPIRGFGRVRDRAFVTSVARVRSDIWLLEDFLPAPTLWQRLWPSSRTP
jgi:Tol biopolymer transport system component